MSANTQRSPDQTVAIDGNEKNIYFVDDQFCVVAAKAQSVDFMDKNFGDLSADFQIRALSFSFTFSRESCVYKIYPNGESHSFGTKD